MKQIVKNNLVYLLLGNLLPYLLILAIQKAGPSSLSNQRNVTYFLLSIMLVVSIINIIKNLKKFSKNEKMWGCIFIFANLLIGLFSFLMLGVLYSTRNGIGF